MITIRKKHPEIAGSCNCFLMNIMGPIPLKKIMGECYLFQNCPITNIKPYYKVRDNRNKKNMICVPLIKRIPGRFSLCFGKKNRSLI